MNIAITAIKVIGGWIGMLILVGLFMAFLVGVMYLLVSFLPFFYQVFSRN